MQQNSSERIRLLCHKIDQDNRDGGGFYREFLSTICYFGLQEADAEDIWQTTFLHLTTENLKGNYPIDTYNYPIDISTPLNEDTRLKNWLKTCLTNRRKDYQRSLYTKKNRIVSFQNATYLLEDIAVHDNPIDNLIRQEEKEIVNNLLSELTPPYREIIEFVAFEGLTYRETAERLHIPLGTVKSRLHQIRKFLLDEYTNKAA